MKARHLDDSISLLRAPHFVLATGATLAVLLAEWLLVSRFQLGIHQDEAARTLLGLIGVSLVIGLMAGVLAIVANRFWAESPEALSLACVIAVLAFLEALQGNRTGDGPAGHALAVASGVLSFLMILGIARYLPTFVFRAQTWWVTAASGFVAALALTALNAVDSAGAAIVLVGSAASAALLSLGLSGTRSRTWHAAAVLLIVAGTSAYAGIRVPFYKADIAASTSRPSVLLITMDTLRADHVGAYGYDRARTPNLDRLASEGVLFSEAVTASVWTGPSHTSMLTGLLPERHGVIANGMRLSDSLPTITGTLREQGYVTSAFVSGWTTMDVAWGVPSRFHAFDDDIRVFRWLPQQATPIAALKLIKRAAKVLGFFNGYDGQLYRMGSDTTDAAIRWLEKNGDRPFFVWLHVFDPHLPYRTPTPDPVDSDWKVDPATPFSWSIGLSTDQRIEIAKSPEKVAQLIALYDAEIEYVDRQVARMVAAARRAAPNGEVLLVVTSDHGESMGEHDIFWDRDLYDPSLLVPLIIIPPGTDAGATGRRIDQQVSLADIAPTILDYVGLEPQGELDGRSLAQLISDTGGHDPRPAITQVYPQGVSAQNGRVFHSIRENGWKLIRRYPGWGSGYSTRFTDGSQELFDLRADPLELNNLVSQKPNILVGLESVLDTHPPSARFPELELSPEQLEALRSLGYIQ